MGNHDDGSLDREPIIDRPEHKCLGATAGFAGAGQALFIHVRQRFQKVERPDAVPGLQTHKADAPKLVRFGCTERAVGIIRGFIGLGVGEMRVVVADHVIGKGDHPLAGKADAARGGAPILGIDKASFLPVAVRIEYPGERSGPTTPRPIKIARQIKAWKRLNIDFLYTVTLPVNLAENVRLERRLLRQGPEAAAYENMFANIPGAFQPLFARRDGRKIARGVEVFTFDACVQIGLD